MRHCDKRLLALLLAVVIFASAVWLFFVEPPRVLGISAMDHWDELSEEAQDELNSSFMDDFGVTWLEFYEMSEEERFDLMWEEKDDLQSIYPKDDPAVLQDWFDDKGIPEWMQEDYDPDAIDDDWWKEWVKNNAGSLVEFDEPNFDFLTQSEAEEAIAMNYGCYDCDWDGVLINYNQSSLDYYMDLSQAEIADIQGCAYCGDCDLHFHDSDTCSECGRHLCDNAHCMNGHCFEDYNDMNYCEGDEVFEVGCGGDCVFCCMEEIFCEEGEDCVCCPNAADYESYHCPSCGSEYGHTEECDSCGMPCACVCDEDRCPSCDLCLNAMDYEERHCPECGACSEDFDFCDICGVDHCRCLNEACPDCLRECNLECIYCDICGHCTAWEKHDTLCDYCPYCAELRAVDDHLTCREHVEAANGKYYCSSPCANRCEYCPDCGSCYRTTTPCDDCGAPCDCYCRENRCADCDKCLRSITPCPICEARCDTICLRETCERCGLCDNGQFNHYGNFSCPNHPNNDCPCYCLCQHYICYETCDECDAPAALDELELDRFTRTYELVISVTDDVTAKPISDVPVFLYRESETVPQLLGKTDGAGTMRRRLTRFDGDSYRLYCGGYGEEYW